MSFVSLRFAGFVITVILLYYVVRPKYRYIVLWLASIYFYLLTGIGNFIYILVTTLTTFGAALRMDNISVRQKAYLADNKEKLSKEEKKEYKASQKKLQKRILVLCLIVNIGILFFLKYANWFIAYFNMYRLNLTGNMNFVPFLNIVLPLGISFYTFQAVGYLLDVYYGKISASHDILKFSLFVSFFPQIIQGPISRFNDLMPELIKETAFDWNNIKSGFYRIMWGLFKKLVIADRVAPYVRSSMDFAQYYKGPYILLGLFLYSFQIYGDFSGGIDIALGVAEMLGINVTDNFERPFFSKSISEYWRRWHITLGTWFKDYIFYPLSLNKTVLKLAKFARNHISEEFGKRIPIYLPMIGVWTLTGMWHGSESRYVVWGLFNCFFIILGTEFEPLSLRIMEKLSLKENMFIVKSYRIIKTFWLMTLLRVFDITKDVTTAFDTLKGLFVGWGLFSVDMLYEWYGFEAQDLYIALIAIVILFTVSMLSRSVPLRKRIFALPTVCQWGILTLLVLAVVLFGSYGIGYDASSFVYMQF